MTELVALAAEARRRKTTYGKLVEGAAAILGLRKGRGMSQEEFLEGVPTEGGAFCGERTSKGTE